MAVERIPNYNRIIDINFLINKGTADKAVYVEDPALTITCPRRGIKPSIEITGSFTTDTCLPPFNVAIKNLYMDIPNTQYPQLKVTAGYENTLQSFIGTILTMYQESPGPEGRTIIQCLVGTTQTWLDTIVKLQFDGDSYKLTDALQKIADSLGLRLICSESVKGMTGKTSLQFEGKVQEAMQVLKNIFQEEKLVITARADELRAYSKNDKKGINDFELKYIATPPQQNAGTDGIIYGTIVAPWIPTLRPGDKVTYSTWQFMKNYSVSRSDKASLIVDNIQFHFGTVGSVNQMTIQGHAV